MLRSVSKIWNLPSITKFNKLNHFVIFNPLLVSYFNKIRRFHQVDLRNRVGNSRKAAISTKKKKNIKLEKYTDAYILLMLNLEDIVFIPWIVFTYCYS